MDAVNRLDKGNSNARKNGKKKKKKKTWNKNKDAR